MQITLNQDEIFDALESYVRSRIQIRSNQAIEIDLKASRGEHGYSATLDIINKEEAQTAMDLTPPAPAAPKTRSAPKAEPKASAPKLTPKVEEPAEEAKEETPEEKPEEAPKPAPSSKSIFAKSS